MKFNFENTEIKQKFNDNDKNTIISILKFLQGRIGRNITISSFLSLYTDNKYYIAISNNINHKFYELYISDQVFALEKFYYIVSLVDDVKTEVYAINGKNDGYKAYDEYFIKKENMQITTFKSGKNFEYLITKNDSKMRLLLEYNIDDIVDIIKKQKELDAFKLFKELKETNKLYIKNIKVLSLNNNVNHEIIVINGELIKYGETKVENSNYKSFIYGNEGKRKKLER